LTKRNEKTTETTRKLDCRDPSGAHYTAAGEAEEGADEGESEAKKKCPGEV
jgi:hypothetical protein